MKNIFKAIDGQIFEKEVDCLKHEFELKGGKENLWKEIDSAHDELAGKHGIELRNINYDARIERDQDPNTDEIHYEEWQEFDFDVYKDGKKIGERFGRCHGVRGDSKGFTKEYIIEEVEREYVYPSMKEFYGTLTVIHDIYWTNYLLNNVDLGEVFLKNQGKRVKIEILD